MAALTFVLGLMFAAQQVLACAPCTYVKESGDPPRTTTGGSYRFIVSVNTALGESPIIEVHDTSQGPSAGYTRYTCTASPAQGSLPGGTTARFICDVPISNYANNVTLEYQFATCDTGSTTAGCHEFTGFIYNFSTATPTAANSTISGRITNPDGSSVSGANVLLSGTESRRTITDADGFYRFDNVETNGFYTVTPSRANYSFNPGSRSFSIVGNRADAVFTGEAGPQTANPLDTDLYFVRQHYLDFLNREPEAGGLAYWATQLEGCRGEAGCLRDARINVSAAFFVAEELQQRGAFIHRLYKGALGRQVGYREFSSDRELLTGGSNLDAARAAFVEAFVQRPEFTQKYSGATSAQSFVDALIRTVREASGVDLSAGRASLVASYNAGGSMNEGRSLALRQAVEEASFKSAEYNKAFVLMQYFGYLKRDPEAGGYQFWLDVLNNREPNNYRGMVCSFLTSEEYQKRFGSFISHTNGECGR